MSYTQEQYAYLMHAQQQSLYFNQHQPQVAFQGYHHGHPAMMVQHAYAPYLDHPDGIYYTTDFDESNEATTRPRLTKEQVSMLENQFQDNPKPNSSIKRNLANRTGLNLPRVANWFQNRRAKAKQQRKQEEFEEAQKDSGHGPSKQRPAVKKDEGESDDEDDTKEESAAHESKPTRQYSNAAASKPSGTMSRSPQRNERDPEKLRACQASLERALAQGLQARDAAAQQAYLEQCMASNQMQAMTMPMTVAQPLPHPMTLMTTAPVPSQPSTQFWNPDATNSWVTQQSAHGNMGFDFGFDSAEPTALPKQESVVSPGDSASQIFETPEAWTHPMTTPTLTNSSQFQMTNEGAAEPMPNMLQFPKVMSSHVGQKLPSTAETITHNLEGIDIGQSAAHVTSEGSVSSGTSDGVDLASRRRRPRPAALALGPGNLRSRSYGQLSAASPTFRSGMTPPANPSLRQTKSTGHGLNSHYAGIRKSSLPQKSPLQITFSDAEYKKLLEHQQATQRQFALPSTEPAQETSLPYRITNTTTADLPSRAAFNSPPTTPYSQHFFAQPQSSAQQPAAIQQQYASVSETPPYSAGPMTATSWDWNSVTSPELSSFPQSALMPSLPFSSCAEDQNLSQWTDTFDQSQVYSLGTPTALKGPDFLYNEFQQRKLDEQNKQPTSGQMSKNLPFENRGQRDFAY